MLFNSASNEAKQIYLNPYRHCGNKLATPIRNRSIGRMLALHVGVSSTKFICGSGKIINNNKNELIMFLCNHQECRQQKCMLGRLT